MAKNKEFYSVLSEVQEFVTTNYSTTITKLAESEKEHQLKAYVKKYLEDNKIVVEGYTKEEIVNKLYREMSEFSLLTDYLNRLDVEEININAYDDIKVSLTNGVIETLEETFQSPQHAIDVVKRLLQTSKMVLDESSPIVVGHLGNKIRITAIHKGVVDENIGVACSIRIVNAQQFTKKDFVAFGTATEEMLDTLILLHKHGASTCFSGSTGSGKTTLMDMVLSEIPEHKRLFTIESNTREMERRKQVLKNGKLITTNNVIHTKTKISESEKHSITMEKLLETSLTFNPDFICVAEMKSSEAFFAQEASRSGHIVSTSTHANGCIATYDRMLTLCKLATDIDSNILYPMLYEAFPIVAFCKKLEDNSRRIMEITECELIRTDYGLKPKFRTLYKFKTEKNIIENGKLKVVGKFVKMNNISENLQEELKMNGILENDLEKILRKPDVTD